MLRLRCWNNPLLSWMFRRALGTTRCARCTGCFAFAVGTTLCSPGCSAVHLAPRAVRGALEASPSLLEQPSALLDVPPCTWHHALCEVHRKLRLRCWNNPLLSWMFRRALGTTRCARCTASF